jgi:hypothetical protein
MLVMRCFRWPIVYGGGFKGGILKANSTWRKMQSKLADTEEYEVSMVVRQSGGGSGGCGERAEKDVNSAAGCESTRRSGRCADWADLTRSARIRNMLAGICSTAVV